MEDLKQQLKGLELQRDSLRSQLKKSDLLDEGKFESLKKLDELFFRLCKKHDLELSKFGRLK